MYNLLHSIEFYVIAVVVAAALIALLGRTPSRGPIRRYRISGVMLSPRDVPSKPGLELTCDDDCRLTIRRGGLSDGVWADVAIEIEQKGFDLQIHEKLTPASPGSLAKVEDAALFTLDFLAREHYFISYHSAATPTNPEGVANFTVNIKPGLRSTRQLN